MIKRFSTYLIILIVSLFLVVPVLAANPAAGGNYGLDDTAGAAGLKAYGGSLPTLVGNVIGTGLSLIAVLFFALMIYGGFSWMTSRGNEEGTKKALNTITAAVIGIIIVMASYAITTFVMKTVPSGGVTTAPGKFCLTDDKSECLPMTGQPCASESQTFDTKTACEVVKGGGGIKICPITMGTSDFCGGINQNCSCNTSLTCNSDGYNKCVGDAGATAACKAAGGNCDSANCNTLLEIPVEGKTCTDVGKKCCKLNP